jgi:hypothetical protein
VTFAHTIQLTYGKHSTAYPNPNMAVSDFFLVVISLNLSNVAYRYSIMITHPGDSHHESRFKNSN